MKIARFLKLALPAAAVLLLAGCVTDPYRYGGGYGGDYYYGRPSVDYRHHGYYGPHGYGYGYPYRGRGGWSFGLRYGYPYGYGGYGGYGYGWPYYYRGWPGYPPIVVRPRPDPEPGHDPDGGDDQGPPPWRDLDNLRDRDTSRIDIEPRLPQVQRPTQPPRTTRPIARPTERPAPRQRPSRSGGDRLERVRTLRERDER